MKGLLFGSLSTFALLAVVAIAPSPAKAEMQDQNLAPVPQPMMQPEIMQPETMQPETMQPETMQPMNSATPSPTMASITSVSDYQINPFELAYLARFGYFEEQGIPGYAGLIQDYRSGSLSGRDLVKVAIDSNRLDSSMMMDESYISSVDRMLNSLAKGSNSNN